MFPSALAGEFKGEALDAVHADAGEDGFLDRNFPLRALV